MDFKRAAQFSPYSGCVRRESWEDPQRKVRPATEGDQDYLNMDNIENVWVEDCPKSMDCAIRIYISTPEDENADDWETVECNKK